jgi:esterase/lipase superfamily enzyme
VRFSCLAVRVRALCSTGLEEVYLDCGGTIKTVLQYNLDEPLRLVVQAPGATTIRIFVSVPSRLLLESEFEGAALRVDLPPFNASGPIQVNIHLAGRPATRIDVACRLAQSGSEVVWTGTPETDQRGRATASAVFPIRPIARTDEAEPGGEVVALPMAVEKSQGSRPTLLFGRKRVDGAEYLVWYGTNRKPVDEANPRRGYSAERDDRLHHGRCRVFIPKSHKIGSTGSPWWKRLISRTDDRLRIQAVEPLAANQHWADLRRIIAGLEAGRDHAVVFIHGYNVSFEEAAVRAAQVGFDLQVRAMAFFSWPSRGTVKGYIADTASIEASEGALAAYLAGFTEQSGASHVHVIAHSMGNRGLLRAVNRSLATAERRAGAPFGQFILAAPDVDVDVFRDLSRAYQGVCRRATLYVSARDRAVSASLALHGAPRVGYTPPVTVLPHIDTVSVSNVDLTLLGHGYVAEARDVLHDMHNLIFHGDPPERRMGLRPEETDEGRYWTIGA